MTFPQILTGCMMVFMLIGALDHLCGDKYGLGTQFLRGFEAFGSLAVTMTGVLVLLPYVERFLGPLISPLCHALGMDPAMVVGMFLACDMGGYPLAGTLSDSAAAIGLGGMLLGSMMGANIVFNIPVALGMVKAEDRPAMSLGILCGFITIPIGCFCGGLVAGYDALLTLRLLIPVIVVSLVIALLLWLIPGGIAKAFLLFGKVISIVATIACVLSICQSVTGLLVLPGLGDIRDAMDLVVNIVLILPGTYVMVTLLSRLLAKPVEKLGQKLHINSTATTGLVTTIANCIPTMGMTGDMDRRGKVLNFAFLVSGGYLLGDHMAFCNAMEPTLVLPMIVGKAVAAVTALLLAMLLTRHYDTESK